MIWYCKFCKLFTRLDENKVCFSCQLNKRVFSYTTEDENMKREEIEATDYYRWNLE